MSENTNKINGRLTDETFWNLQWKKRAGQKISYRLLHNKDHGKNGRFLKILEREIPLSDLKSLKVVELGGAASQYLVDLGKYAGLKVTALDYSKVGIDQTIELFELNGVNGDVICADMFNWKDGHDSYDLVTHWGVLEHFSDPTDVIEASAKFLKAGGYTAFSMPNLAAYGARWWRKFSPKNFAAHIYHQDSKILACLEKSGFEVLNYFHFGPPLIRMAPLERRGISSLLINTAHAIVCIWGTISPKIYMRGTSKISSQRMFIARKLKQEI